MRCRPVAVATLLLLNVALVACGSSNDPDTRSVGSEAEGPASPESWTLPGPDYSYTVNAGCGERGGLLGVYRITVADGEVVAAQRLSDYAAKIGPSDAATISDLLAEAAAADRSGADEVTIASSPEGYPYRIVIDHVSGAIDDEVCYTITDVVRSTRPSGRPLASWGESRPGVERNAAGNIVMTTWGSSSCPWEPEVVAARGSSSTVVRLIPPDRQAVCTADLAPHRSALDLPRRIDVDASNLTFVVIAPGYKPVVVPLIDQHVVR